MSSVSKNIKKLRLQTGQTQEAMANKLFVTRQTISNWETGKSQPDIDTLMKIADSLNTNITTLIYGPPDTKLEHEKKRHLVIAAGIIVLLCISIYVTARFAANMSKYFLTQPTIFLHLYLLPLTWLVLPWTILQGLSVLGILKPLKSRFNRILRSAALSITLLYGILMLPYLINLIGSTVQFFQYLQNSSAYPDGYQYTSIIPNALYQLALPFISIVYKCPMIFLIPSIIFWISKPDQKKQSKNEQER